MNSYNSLLGVNISLVNSLRIFVSSYSRAWNPYFFNYILGSRSKLTIINPLSIYSQLKKSLLFIRNVVLKGGKLFIINEFLKTHKKNSLRSNSYTQFKSWVPGVLTNKIIMKGFLAAKMVKNFVPSINVLFKSRLGNVSFLRESSSVRVPSIAFMDAHFSHRLADYSILSSSSYDLSMYYTSLISNLLKNSLHFLKFNYVTSLYNSNFYALKEIDSSKMITTVFNKRHTSRKFNFINISRLRKFKYRAAVLKKVFNNFLDLNQTFVGIKSKFFNLSLSNILNFYIKKFNSLDYNNYVNLLHKGKTLPFYLGKKTLYRNKILRKIKSFRLRTVKRNSSLIYKGKFDKKKLAKKIALLNKLKIPHKIEMSSLYKRRLFKIRLVSDRKLISRISTIKRFSKLKFTEMAFKLLKKTSKAIADRRRKFGFYQKKVFYKKGRRSYDKRKFNKSNRKNSFSKKRYYYRNKKKV